jgi:hypothetical protein
MGAESAKPASTPTGAVFLRAIRSWLTEPVGVDDCFRPRLCENSFRSPRRIANRRIRCDKSPELHLRG